MLIASVLCKTVEVQALMNSHGPIFIVDDDPDISGAIRELFELTGHAVVTARDGTEAMCRLRQGLVPCLILLDIEMPGGDGISFRREQLADSALASIPVILHSSRPDLAQLAAQLQAAAHVSKNIDFDTLLPLVATHCNRSDT